MSGTYHDEQRGELDAGRSQELAAPPADGAADPVPDPGLPAHQPRLTDVDPKAADRAERQVATMFGLSALATIGLIVGYFAVPKHAIVANMSASNLVLGAGLGLALLLIGLGAIQWSKKLMDDHEIVEERHPIASPEQDRVEAVAIMKQGASESGLGRRKLIRGSLLGALGVLGIPPIILLGDLGPLPGNALSHTIWKRGVRVVNDVDYKPLRPADLELGSLVNGAPESMADLEGTELQVARAKAPVILVRMRPDEIHAYPSRKDWSVGGIICYSKICPHVGCPTNLYEQQTHHLLCPCHQSTFDLADNGKVLFGPAARNLPQLPIMVDSEGYLVAQSDFTEPVGPSFWERG